MTSDQTGTIGILLRDSVSTSVQALHKAGCEISAPLNRSLNAPPMRSSSSSIQTTSTTAYEQQEQEAQDAFNRRIEKLCQDLWPLPTSIKYRLLASQAAIRLRTHKFFRSFISAPQIPLIQHLKGGGLNHITSILLPPSYLEGHRNLILRVPREDDSRPDQQVATLNYVR